MKYYLSIVFGLFIISISNSQTTVLSQKWIDSIQKNFGFNKINTKKFEQLDFSKILSNRLALENDPLSTYVGCFGPKYRRIDFHFKVKKKNNKYLLTGKSKLGNNIRPIKGEMKLKIMLYREQQLIPDKIKDTLYIAFFDCVMKEPGDRNGDGIYQGIFTLVFYIENGKIMLFKSDSGDWPTFTNTFVGVWKRYNSNVKRKVIFSFHVAGLYERLPFCDDFYSQDENYDEASFMKEKYLKYGWKEYYDKIISGSYDKDYWWK